MSTRKKAAKPASKRPESQVEQGQGNTGRRWEAGQAHSRQGPQEARPTRRCGQSAGRGRGADELQGDHGGDGGQGLLEVPCWENA